MGNASAYDKPNNEINSKKAYLRKTKTLYIKGIKVKTRKQIALKLNDTQ
jgi:hypothetical protein